MNLNDYLKSNYRASAVRSYRNRIGRFVGQVGESKTILAKYQDVLGYIDSLRQNGLHAKSLRHELAAVKIYYDWLFETEQRADHPCRTMVLRDAVDKQIRLEELYTNEQLESLLTGYKSANVQDQKRGEVIIGLLVNQALTAGEVTRLRLVDVDLEAGTVHVAAGGKTAERTLGLRAHQVLGLYRYIEEDRGRYVVLAKARSLRVDWLLFDTKGGSLSGGDLNRLINRGRKKSEKLRPQKIRQTVIAELVAAGHDVRIVQAFAGHRRSSSTEAYKRTGLEELAEAVVKWHPRGGSGETR